MKIPLSIDAYHRTRAKQPEIRLENRYFEKSPTNLKENVSLIIRPALRNRVEVGDGPLRRVYWQADMFDDDLMVVSGFDLYRVELDDTVTQITGTVDNSPLVPDLVATETDLWVADFTDLQYTDGTAALAAVTMPGPEGPVSIDVIDGYVLVVPAFSQQVFWIDPGAYVIDPLDFFSAERSPDYVQQVRTFGDQFWLFGKKTTEPWRHTGDPLAPFQRIEGRVFDHGTWSGTAVLIKDEVIVVGADGHVYAVGDRPRIISSPGVAERVFQAIQAES